MNTKCLILFSAFISSLSSAMGGNLRVEELTADRVQANADQSIELIQYIDPKEKKADALFLEKYQMYIKRYCCERGRYIYPCERLSYIDIFHIFSFCLVASLYFCL